MRRSFTLLFVLWLASAGTGGRSPALAGAAGQAETWTSKVDGLLLAEAARGETDFLIFLSEQADLSRTAALPTKAEKGRYVFETLKATAARTQGPVLAGLARRGVAYRAYWVANMVWVRGDANLVQTLAQRPDVFHLYADTPVQIDLPAQPAGALSQAPSGVEWNIDKVRAPLAWAAGVTGQGAVIGGQDTGYDWDHPALKSKYRGWDGTTASHAYNWHDAIHENLHSPPGNVCDFDSPVPCDDDAHGTHTMGTMVGDDGAGNQVGMAPGAQWIGCRNMEDGSGRPSTYSECYEWFIAPYPPGADPASGDPTKAPDVINNSWGCPPSEGCTAANVLEAVVNSVRAAGILTVHSAGNDGSACSTISDPAAITDASFTVGATDRFDNIAGFSSRGPVTVDDSNRLKPDISAPGVNIRSSVPGGGYRGGWSGTSMAGPHVAGLAALLISFRPELAGHPDQIEDAIRQSAVPRTTTEDCGEVPGSQVPNNTYGWGRIDAWAAIQSLQEVFVLSKAAPASVRVGEEITYTLAIDYPVVPSPTHNVVLTDTLPTGTSFVRATAPYTSQNGTLRWDFASLAPGERVSVTLVVRAPETLGLVTNEHYGVRSDEIPLILGGPVRTRVRPLVEFLIFLPLVFP